MEFYPAGTFILSQLSLNRYYFVILYTSSSFNPISKSKRMFFLTYQTASLQREGLSNLGNMVVAFSARFTIVGPHVNYRGVTSLNKSGYSTAFEHSNQDAGAKFEVQINKLSKISTEQHHGPLWPFSRARWGTQGVT